MSGPTAFQTNAFQNNAFQITTVSTTVSGPAVDTTLTNKFADGKWFSKKDYFKVLSDFKGDLAKQAIAAEKLLREIKAERSLTVLQRAERELTAAQKRLDAANAKVVEFGPTIHAYVELQEAFEDLAAAQDRLDGLRAGFRIEEIRRAADEARRKTKERFERERIELVSTIDRGNLSGLKARADDTKKSANSLNEKLRHLNIISGSFKK